MELFTSLCNCNNDQSDYVDICCFDPITYFVCTLCRGAFENIGKLLLHKRQEHTVEELKGIKFIIFEERTVKTDSDNDKPFSTSLEIKDKWCGNQQIQDETFSDPNQQETQSENFIDDIRSNFREFKLTKRKRKPNPYVLLRRLSLSELQLCLKPSIINGTTQNQVIYDCTPIHEDEKCELEECNLPSPCSQKSEDISIDSDRTIINLKDFNPNDEPKHQHNTQTQEITNAEFIQATVLQSVDEAGKVQLFATFAPGTDLPVEPMTTTNVLFTEINISDAKQEDYKDDDDPNSDSLKVETASMFDDVDSYFSTSDVEPTPVSDLPHSVPKLPTPTSPAGEHSAESCSTNGEAQILPINTSTSRTLRNRRSKINYSENTTCTNCRSEFYTTQDLDEHEKLCQSRNYKNKGNCRKNESLTTISHMTEGTLQTTCETRDDAPHDEILVEQSSANFEEDKDNVPGGEDEDEISEDCKYPAPAEEISSREIECEEQRVRMDIKDPANFVDCPLSIKEWLQKERKTNPENIILLDPEPFPTPTPTPTEPDGVDEAETTTSFVATPDNPIKCKLCTKKLTSDPSAKSHLKYCWLHNKNHHVYCPICPKSFTGKRGIYHHNRLKHVPGLRNSKTLKCTVCSKELTANISNFKKHMEIHEKPNLKNFICAICGTGFRSKYKLQNHQVVHSKERPFKCKLCPQSFKTTKVLSSHQLVHTKNKNYHCSTCSKSFKSKWRVREHARIHLNDRDRRYPCKAENCDLKFFSNFAVSQHCKKDHKELFSRMAQFSCTVCDEKFEYSSLFKKHEMLHSGQKPFKCSAEGCSRAFREKVTLNEHLRQHTGERPFQCDKCGTAFWKKSSFDKHMKAHNNPPDQVLCHLCPRKFPHNYELQQHLIFHEKGKQFKCDTCGFKCMTKAGLKGHMKTHDKAKGDVDSGSSSSSESENEDTTEESSSESENEVEKNI